MREFVRLLIVLLVSALLVAATVSIAFAGAGGAVSTVAAQPAPTAGGSAGIIRTIGIVGTAAVWALRGYSSIRRSRHERQDPSEDQGTEEVDGDRG